MLLKNWGWEDHTWEGRGQLRGADPVMRATCGGPRSSGKVEKRCGSPGLWSRAFAKGGSQTWGNPSRTALAEPKWAGVQGRWAHGAGAGYSQAGCRGLSLMAREAGVPQQGTRGSCRVVPPLAPYWAWRQVWRRCVNTPAWGLSTEEAGADFPDLRLTELWQEKDQGVGG